MDDSSWLCRLTSDLPIPIYHSPGCPGAIASGIGFLVDTTLGEAEVRRRISWLMSQLYHDTGKKVFREA